MIRLRSVVVAGAIISGALSLAMSGARADSGSATVPDVADAWYASAPADACTLPVGCLPGTPATPYPAGTLHVGVVGGQEIERSFVRLDLSLVPTGATVTGATLTLPLSTDQDAGQVQVTSAAFGACLATEPITDGVAGNASGAPGVDCATASATATLSGDGKAFTVDLAPLLAAWHGGIPDDGIALVPGGNQAPGASWQVSLDGKASAATTKISATVTYTTANGEATAAPPPSVPASGAGSATGPVVVPPPVAQTETTTPSVPPVIAPTPVANETRPAAATRLPWFAVRGVVYFPLAVLVGAWLLSRALVRPATHLVGQE